MNTKNILEQILASTRQAVAQRKQAKPLAKLKEELRQRPPAKDLAVHLRGQEIKLIAEIKKASPSRGVFPGKLDTVELAQSYLCGGAAAISVLTESNFFKGGFDDLALVRKTVDLPVLCKDFILDTYQVYEAGVYGADAVLLITTILTHQEMKSLLALTLDLGLSALVEIHEERDLIKALSSGAHLIGINNRNLSDFSTDLQTTLRLRPLIPHQLTVVSESGIHSALDVAKLKAAGVDAILVGETLVTSPDPAVKIKELLGKSDGQG